VQITSAIALGEDEVKSLGDRIGQSVDRQVQVTADVDPDILGGIVLRVGNVVLDASIKNRLEQLRKQVAQA
jgi:F0F1-type ATP synthase delta subunit